LFIVIAIITTLNTAFAQREGRQKSQKFETWKTVVVVGEHEEISFDHNIKISEPAQMTIDSLMKIENPAFGKYELVRLDKKQLGLNEDATAEDMINAAEANYDLTTVPVDVALQLRAESDGKEFTLIATTPVTPYKEDGKQVIGYVGKWLFTKYAQKEPRAVDSLVFARRVM
jgi:hypothetical protein